MHCWTAISCPAARDDMDLMVHVLERLTVHAAIMLQTARTLDSDAKLVEEVRDQVDEAL